LSADTDRPWHEASRMPLLLLPLLLLLLLLLLFGP
jgi:hypothetical protein